MLRGPQRRFSFVAVVLWALRIAIVVGVLGGSYATLSAGRFTLSDWQNLVVYGIAQGSVYALIALGYTLVYGVLFMINFAHGDVFMVGAMSGFFVADALEGAGLVEANPILALLITMLCAALISMVVAILLERLAYRRLRRAPRLVPLITAIGASLFISNSVRGIIDERVHAYPRIDLLEGRLDLLGISILKTHAVVIASAVILMFALWYLVERTRTGRAMRAVAEDKEVAGLMGIDVDRVIVTTFAVGGALAGAAGVLYALVFGSVHWFIGFLPGIKAFTAAVLGGIGNIFGAMLGGLSLGVLESVGPSLLLNGVGVPSTNQLRDVIAFSVLVLVLIFRPYGILGRSDEAR